MIFPCVFSSVFFCCDISTDTAANSVPDGGCASCAMLCFAVVPEKLSVAVRRKECNAYVCKPLFAFALHLLRTFLQCFTFVSLAVLCVSFRNCFAFVLVFVFRVVLHVVSRHATPYAGVLIGLSVVH